MQPLIRAACLACFGLLPLPSLAQVELIMGEEEGCIWCARWNAEVAPEYPKTAEGRAAPLRRVDIHAPLPEGLALDGRLTFTPTFVLVENGRELARLEGYPGEDFFWPLLGRMLDEAVETTPQLDGWRDER
ncbi:hypothetical protein [Jannaschia ovalis]|uniref:Regulatory protein SoxS n=1 Tax=Jannaschia ovalis TaxID=3038773 RepID=A0ABY8LEP3_9RHOB|nr:hypothetical protein [Jannaschia sp. GRR-S6-38]WGH79636.1 hypothetical protein P8627_05070 [Jannaschia sp. GRR-S6-38]